VGPGARADRATHAAVIIDGESVIAVIATVVSFVVFLLMLEESIAITSGRDPISNDVRAAVRRFPRATYAVAVVIGMVLGHLLWP
jgi:hypothetical protein